MFRRKYLSTRKPSRYRRRTTYRKRRFSRFRRPRRTISRYPYGYYRFKRSIAPITINGVATPYQVGFSSSFALDHIPNYSQFVALYDQFRIRGIQIKFNLGRDTAAGGNYNYLPSLYVWKDYNDQTIPTQANALMRQDAKRFTLRSDRQFSMYFKPAVLGYAYAGVTPGYAPKFNQWISTVDSDTIYYGLKFFMEHFHSDQQLVINVKYYLEFKHAQ